MAAKELSATSLFSDPNLVWYGKLESTTAAIGSNLSTNGTINFVSAVFNNGSSSGTSNTANSLFIDSNLGVITGAVSYSFWAKVLTQPATNSAGCFFGLRTTGGGSNFVDWLLWYEDVSGTKRLRYERNGPGLSSVDINYNVDLGTTNFNYFTFTYDGTSTRAYLNGALVGGPTTATGYGNGGADKFTIHGSNGTFDLSSAIVDDFAVFTRELTASDIALLAPGNSGSNLSLLRTG